MAQQIIYRCAQVIIPTLALEAVRKLGKVGEGKQDLLGPKEIGSLKTWLARFGYVAHVLEDLLECMEAEDLPRPRYQEIGYEKLLKLIKEMVDNMKKHSQFFTEDIDSTSFVQKNINTKKTTSQENQNNTHQTKSSPTIDPSDPLFIHTSDHSSMILVPIVLNGTNYAMWRRVMWRSLSEKKKLGFIKGTIPRPSKSDPKRAVWQRCNDMVLSWILNTLNEKLAKSVLHMNTPSEIWLHLQELLVQDDFSQHYQIQRSIVELKQNQDSISLYYTKIKTLWDELEMCSPTISYTCGGLKQLSDMEERVRLGQFLMGLNESYSVIKKQIMLMQPLPTVKKAYSLLCEEEKKRGLVEQKIPDQSHSMNVKSEKILDQSHAMNVKSEKIPDQSHAMNLKSEEIVDQSHAMNVKSKEILDQSHAMNVKSEEVHDQSHDMNVKSEKILDHSHAMNVKSDSPSTRQDSTFGSSKIQRSKKRFHCTYCGGSTHTVKWCFYLNGFPIGHYLHGKDVQPPNRGARKVFVNQTRAESTQAIHTSNQSLQFAREEFSQTKDFLSKENPPISASTEGYEKDVGLGKQGNVMPGSELNAPSSTSYHVYFS